jgi:hypothetical protein
VGISAVACETQVKWQRSESGVDGMQLQPVITKTMKGIN